MAPQDSFIDDDDDTCPLCVEEFDLSDKNFRPCPCGYQVCQFCYNNIKNNINGLCPACRRPYDEKTIEFKVVTPEEIAQFRATVQKNAKKKQDQRQKEAQKREVESLNRKHLSGLRVIQKNLVYVVGLSPSIPDQEIISTLRGDKYFGQYGKILKIVVANKKDQGANALGVYVTFARKEDAQRCIAAVNGSQNGDRVLRAQLGTTKYCSAYLRSETCTNKNCMFLHEPGDNEDSYSRQDLSSINSINTQRPLNMGGPSSSRQAVQQQAPLQHFQPLAAATQSMVRDGSKDGSDSGDGSALPTTASWGNRGIQIQQRSRRGSHATSGAASSPAVSQAMPVTEEVIEEPQEEPEDQEPEAAIIESPATDSSPPEPPRPARNQTLLHLLRHINSPALSYTRSVPAEGDESQLEFPPLFDENGGEKRRVMREHQEEDRLHLDQESQADLRSVGEPLEEEEPESGSLQLGGEPEDRDHGREASIVQGFNGQTRRPSTQLPIQRSLNGGPFGPSLSQNFPQNLQLSSINGRTLTPEQQRQLLALKSGQQQSNFIDQYPPGMGGQLGQGAGLFQQQGHNRQSSRYSFANDGPSASPSVKPSANPKLMAQQTSMMPSVHQGNQFYGTSMQGPPPGLKSSGTPPIGGMFGQGQHVFGGSMAGSSGFGGLKENSGEMIRDVLRGRGPAVGGQLHDASKQEDQIDTPENTASVDALVADSTADDFISRTLDSYDHSTRTSTPTVPPGFEHPPGFASPIRPPGFDSPHPPPPSSELSHAHPVLPNLEEPIAKPPSRIVPTSKEFTPSRPHPYIPRASTPLANVSVPPTPTAIHSSLNIESSAAQAKREVKALATNTGLSGTIAAQAAHPGLQDEDFPALESGKIKAPQTPSATKPILPVKTPLGATSKKAPAAPSTTQTAIATSKANEKRVNAGLNINVPGKSASKAPSIPDTPSNSIGLSSTAFPPLAPPTPSTQSAVARNNPKTLRVTSTKTEIPPPIATPSSTTSMFPLQPPVRQPSLASFSRLDRPDTPTTEGISDNASITSTSMSRPASPPPTKVGSAPVRVTTKSQQKRARQTQKEKEVSQVEAVTVAKAESPVEIAPIIGRKKKQKKDRTASSAIHSAAGGSTPTASRPATPGLVETPKDISAEVTEKEELVEAPTPVEPEPPKFQNSRSDSKGKGKARNQRPATPEPPPPTVEEEEEEEEPPVVEKPIPTPAVTLQELVAEGVIADPTGLPLLKTPISTYRHQEIPADMTVPIPKLVITPEERILLQAGKPVHRLSPGNNRLMLTPNGDCVRNLSPEEEERFLTLQERLATESGPTAFTSSKHQTNNGFVLISGRAVPSGPPSFFPMSGNGVMDPVSKIQRDEALNFINQNVLPSLSGNSQLEKVLNANVLDTIHSGEGSTGWASWGTDMLENVPLSDGGENRDGGLAMGLESMTQHFSMVGEVSRGLSGMGMGLGDCESALQQARKETEGLEKKFNALLKKNRRILLGSGH